MPVHHVKPQNMAAAALEPLTDFLLIPQSLVSMDFPMGSGKKLSDHKAWLSHTFWTHKVWSHLRGSSGMQSRNVMDKVDTVENWVADIIRNDFEA